MLSYQEGGAYTFGIMNPDGSVLPHTYWPLWAFRNYRGKAASADVQVGNASDEWARSGLTVLSSTDPVTETDSAVLFVDRARSDATNERQLAGGAVHLDWRVSPAASSRTLTVYAADVEGRRLVAAQPVVAGQTSVGLDFKVVPHTAYSLSVEPARNLLPLVEVKPSAGKVLLGERLQVTAEVTNLLPNPIGGKVMLAGLPSDWDIQVAEGQS